MNLKTVIQKAALVAVVILFTLSGCETPVEESSGMGGCWVYDGSQGVLVFLSDGGEVKTVVTDPGDVDYMAAEAQTATLWVTDSTAARLLKVSSSGVKELYVSGFVRPESIALDPDTGGVFLADPGASEVIALDSEGNVLWRSVQGKPVQSLAVAGGESRIVIAQMMIDAISSGFVGLDPADGSTVFELVLPGGYYNLSADPDADHFWLATGEELEMRSSTDGVVLLTVDGLGSPLIAGAMGDDCWVYDAAGLDLLLVDDAGNLKAEIEDLPGVPELSALGDKVWVAVREADFVALYDSSGEREVRVSTILDPSPLAGVR